MAWLQGWHSGGIPWHCPLEKQIPQLGPERGGPTYRTLQPPPVSWGLQPPHW